MQDKTKEKAKFDLIYHIPPCGYKQWQSKSHFDHFMVTLNMSGKLKGLSLWKESVGLDVSVWNLELNDG